MNSCTVTGHTGKPRTQRKEGNNLKNLVYVFVGGMGPRAGSHLYNHFHRAVEKELGSGFVDTDFPDSVLITVPAREEEPYSGRFGLDLAMLEMQLQNLPQHYQNIIVVPMCVTVSDAIKTVCEEYGVEHRTILDFIRGRFPNGATLLCSDALAQQGEQDPAHTYVPCSKVISSYYKPHAVWSAQRLITDLIEDGAPKPVVLACTELSAIQGIESVRALDAPMMFIRNLAKEYVHAYRR